jgi:hypothetical protein
MKVDEQNGPHWTTRRKVVVGILIAAGVFAIANLVVLGLFDRHSDWQFDLATLRLEQVWTTEFLRWQVWRQVEAHNTPASAALAKAGLTTGLSGKAGGGTTYWRTPTWWGGNEYLGMGGPSAFHPILFDNGVVLLLQRKGASGLPTLRKILNRFRAANPDDSQTTGQMLYRTLREDYPAETWPDPWYGTNQPTTGKGTQETNKSRGGR